MSLSHYPFRPNVRATIAWVVWSYLHSRSLITRLHLCIKCLGHVAFRCSIRFLLLFLVGNGGNFACRPHMRTATPVVGNNFTTYCFLYTLNCGVLTRMHCSTPPPRAHAAAARHSRCIILCILRRCKCSIASHQEETHLMIRIYSHFIVYNYTHIIHIIHIYKMHQLLNGYNNMIQITSNHVQPELCILAISLNKRERARAPLQRADCLVSLVFVVVARRCSFL